MTGAREPEPTRPIDLGDATQPVEVRPTTGPFAPTRQPSRPIPLVSHTAANELIAAAAEADPMSSDTRADPMSTVMSAPAIRSSPPTDSAIVEPRTGASSALSGTAMTLVHP